jgi:hypothetical protein
MWDFIIHRRKSRNIIRSKFVANVAEALGEVCVVQPAQDNVH